MIACKPVRKNARIHSTWMTDRRTTQILFAKHIRADVLTDCVRSCLVGKGCLFHVEVEANAIEAVPSTDGRGAGVTPASRCWRTRTRRQKRTRPQPATAVVRGMDPDGASGPCDFTARRAERRRHRWRRVHSPDGRLDGIDRHDHGRGFDHDVHPPGRNGLSQSHRRRMPRSSSRI